MVKENKVITHSGLNRVKSSLTGKLYITKCKTSYYSHLLQYVHVGEWMDVQKMCNFNVLRTSLVVVNECQGI